MNLNQAILLATQAHQGQFDLGGDPYILHPLRVMLAVPYQGSSGHTEAARIAAVLHDIVEDTSITMEDLSAQWCPLGALRAVEALTKKPGQLYTVYLEQVARDPPAAQIKRLYLLDNLNPQRVARVREDQECNNARVARYLFALGYLDGTL